MSMKPLLRCLLTTLLVFAGSPAVAENSLSVGELTVHYNALSSLDLSPEVARQYAITRSAGRGLVNIAVRRGAAGSAVAVAAQLSGSASNELGQRQSLSFREVREGEAIYYLAEPRVSAGDTLEFAIEVRVGADQPPISLRFRQAFFAPL